MKKSGSQKALKVVSIIMIIFACLTLVFAVLALTGGGVMGFAGMSGAGGEATVAGGLVMVMGFIVLVGGIINLIVGALGLRGANNPQKIGAFYVLSIISLIWAIINVGMSLFAGSFDIGSIISNLCTLILPVLCCGLANSIRKANRH